MKVIIGNDVRLTVKLPLDLEFSNILSAKAIFVNKTLKIKHDKEYKKRNRFIGRFPIEPFVNEFEPSEYNINSCGFYPKYKAFVANQYTGFGVRPDWKKCVPVKEEDVINYFGDISRSEDPTELFVFFPAKVQKTVGVYSLILVCKIPDSNYINGERIITTVIDDSIELVDPISTEEEVQDETPSGSQIPDNDVYVISGEYSDNQLRLTRNDARVIKVDINPTVGWYILE